MIHYRLFSKDFHLESGNYFGTKKELKKYLEEKYGYHVNVQPFWMVQGSYMCVIDTTKEENNK